MLLSLLHPVVHGVEAVTISDVVGHDYTMGALVIRGGDSLESLLSSCVPNLQLAYLIITVDGADLEVYTNRWHEAILELVIGEPEEQTGFTDTRIADHEYFEQVVAKQRGKKC